LFLNSKTQEEQAMKHLRLSTKAVTLFIIIIGTFLIVPCIVTAGQLQPAALLMPRLKPLDKVKPTWSQKLPAKKRFVLVLDGEAVLDRETGLVWERSPNTTTSNLFAAVELCYRKEVGGRKGWRIPTIDELSSLVETTQSNPALPSGHPFLNVQSSNYWSSTESLYNPDKAWSLNMYYGSLINEDKGLSHNYMWAVRGGN
jgi:hypothetical protein